MSVFIECAACEMRHVHHALATVDGTWSYYGPEFGKKSPEQSTGVVIIVPLITTYRPTLI